jgi:hypothetical protein
LKNGSVIAIKLHLIPIKEEMGETHDWQHLKNQDVILMPDKWEYPWYTQPGTLLFIVFLMAMIDPTFAKHQLSLVMREWYMKPDGQLPAYEWNFSDVNPPVQAWAAFKCITLKRKKTSSNIYSLKNLSKADHQFYMVDQSQEDQERE